jgi:hypothetical protein
MPSDDVDEALAWIAAQKPNRNKSVPTVEVYPAKEVQRDSSEARFERLKASEKFIAGQIAGLQERFYRNLKDIGKRREKMLHNPLWQLYFFNCPIHAGCVLPFGSQPE